MRKDGMEALRRVGSLEVLRGAGGGFGTGRKDCAAAAHTMSKDGMARAAGGTGTAWPELLGSAGGAAQGWVFAHLEGGRRRFRNRKKGLYGCRTHHEKGRHGGAAQGWVFGGFDGGQAAVSEPEERTVRQQPTPHEKKRHGGAAQGWVFGGFEGGRRRFRNWKKGLYGSCTAAAHTMSRDGMGRGLTMRKDGMEALRRVGSLEVLRGAGGGFGTGRKDCAAAAHTMSKDGMARAAGGTMSRDGMARAARVGWRRCGSLQVWRGAGGGFGTGRKAAAHTT